MYFVVNLIRKKTEKSADTVKVKELFLKTIISLMDNFKCMHLLLRPFAKKKVWGSFRNN